jgi:hypothetical protein
MARAPEPGAPARIAAATVRDWPKPNRSADRPAIGETITRTARFSARIVVLVRACNDLRCCARHDDDFKLDAGRCRDRAAPSSRLVLGLLQRIPAVLAPGTGADGGQQRLRRLGQ